MPSDCTRARTPADLFVWIWLPGRIEPIVAGRLFPRPNGTVGFLYGDSYLRNGRAIPIYAPELPLRPGPQEPMGNLKLASCIRDASPDAWGRRVIINRMTGRRADAAAAVELDEPTFLRQSGSDRIGALDFQDSPTEYVPRDAAAAPMAELLEASALVEAGVPLTPTLDRALLHGTSIGGARPKAQVIDGDRTFIAKFSARNDTYDVVRSEFLLMRLARLAGLDVAHVRLAHAAGKDVLLVERFDRSATEIGWTRRCVVSALTLQGLDEMEARHASYEDLAELMRRRFVDPAATTRELFNRIVFNVLCGNTDDHARNHAAFWDGDSLSLTPAYDLCPQSRTGGVASQSMKIAGEDRRARIRTCLDAAGIYGLSRTDARRLIEAQMNTIRSEWRAVAEEAELSRVDRRLLAGRALLNPYAFEDLDGPDTTFRLLGSELVEQMRN